MNIIEGLHVNRYAHGYSVMALKPYSWKITKETKNLKALKPGNFARVIDKKGKRMNYVFIIHVLKNISSDQSVSNTPAYKLARAVSIRDNMPDIQRAQTAYIKYLKMKEAHKLPAKTVRDGRFMLTKDPKFFNHPVYQRNPNRVKNIISTVTHDLSFQGTYTVERHKQGFYFKCENAPKTDDNKTKVSNIVKSAVTELNRAPKQHYTLRNSDLDSHSFIITSQGPSPKGNK